MIQGQMLSMIDKLSSNFFRKRVISYNQDTPNIITITTIERLHIYQSNPDHHKNEQKEFEKKRLL